MQRPVHRCPCCEQPLGISWDMWGKYYLCGDCGFTAEDDDDVCAESRKAFPAPHPTITQIQAQTLEQPASRQ